MAASAVTAAIVPSTKAESKVSGFTLTVRTNDGNESTASCQATDNVDAQPCADATDTTNGPSDTTSQDAVSSDATTL